MNNLINLLKRIIVTEISNYHETAVDLNDLIHKLKEKYCRFNCSIILKFVSTSNQLYIFLNESHYAFSEDDWFLANKNGNTYVNELIHSIPNQVRKQLPHYPYQISLMQEQQFIYLRIAFTRDWPELTLAQATYSWLNHQLKEIFIDFEYKIELANQSLNPEKEIRNLQLNLIQLLNQIDDFKNYYDNELVKKIELYQRWVDKMLFFLESNYYQNLEHSRETSRNYKNLKLQNHKGKIDYLSRRLNNFEFVYSYLSQLLDDDVKLDYQYLSYLIDLSESLFDQVYPDKQEITEEKLIEMLVRFNFNSLRFSRFWYKSMLAECYALPDYNTRESYLLQKIADVKKMDIVDNALHPNRPDVIEQVTGFIMKELEDQCRLNRMLEQFQPEKITLNLSVSTIAYFMRISHELNLFPKIKITNLMRKASYGISSYRQPDISFNSFRSKCYSVDNSVKNAVKGLLKRMVDHIDGEPL